VTGWVEKSGPMSVSAVCSARDVQTHQAKDHDFQKYAKRYGAKQV
jgi:hypothetical protein